MATLEGQPAAEVLRFASAAASLCVRKRGALPSLPSRAETAALLQQLEAS